VKDSAALLKIVDMLEDLEGTSYEFYDDQVAAINWLKALRGKVIEMEKNPFDAWARVGRGQGYFAAVVCSGDGLRNEVFHMVDSGDGDPDDLLVLEMMLDRPTDWWAEWAAYWAVHMEEQGLLWELFDSTFQDVIREMMTAIRAEQKAEA